MKFVPSAYTGTEENYYHPMDIFAPQYEDNLHQVLHVCICNGCEALAPRLEQLAKSCRLALKYEDENGNIVSIGKLFKK